MKKIVRLLLLVECFAFFVIFIKDLELLSTSNSLFASMHTAEEWVWLFVGEGLPLLSLAAATVYAFMRRQWKCRYLLAAAIAVYGAFLIVSEPLRVNPNYVSVHPVLTLIAAAAYIACIFTEKIPYRHWIAFGAAMLLAVCLLIAYCVSGGLDSVLDWTPLYVLPLIPLGMLGRILPGKYD